MSAATISLTNSYSRERQGVAGLHRGVRMVLPGRRCEVSSGASLLPSWDYRSVGPATKEILALTVGEAMIRTTSVGRKYFGLIRMRTTPVSFSLPISLMPSPSQLVNTFRMRSDTSIAVELLTRYVCRSLGMQLRRILARCASRRWQ